MDMKRRFRIKRVYEDPAPDDGSRVLVDRIWPRGVAKEEARIKLWLRDVAPSTALRKWFAHRPERWAEFKRRYFDELSAQPDAVMQLRTLAESGPVTLVYSARDEAHNQARALAEYLG
jgi:uncharacterized protein YeaO (DUF488 family)